MNVDTLSKSLSVKSNDMLAVIYLASTIRSVLALHKLIDNKEQRMWREKQAAEKSSKAKTNGVSKDTKGGKDQGGEAKDGKEEAEGDKSAEAGKSTANGSKQ